MERIREDGGKSEIDESHAVTGGPVLVSRAPLDWTPFGALYDIRMTCLKKDFYRVRRGYTYAKTTDYNVTLCRL